MATYTWINVNGISWTTASNWDLNSSYPQLSTDSAYGLYSGIPPNVTLNTNISLATLSTNGTTGSSSTFNISGTGSITFSSTGIINAYNQSTAVVGNISVRVNSAPNSTLKIQGSLTNYWVLKNTSNSIYQINVASGTSFGFDTASCLNIQHPQYIFSGTSTSSVWMFCTGSGGTIARTFWDTAVKRPLYVASNGTGPIKIGITGSAAVPVTSLTLTGSLSPQSDDTNDNQFFDNFNISSAALNKQNVCRWILSGTLVGSVTTLTISAGILQLPVDSVNSSTYTTVNLNGSTARLELSGSGTVRSGLTINATTASSSVRAITNANISVSTIYVKATSVKLSAATGATLTLPSLSTTIANIGNFYLGGEGTVELQHTMFAPNITMTSLNKEDSGTLKMTTNDKVYTAPTNITAGILWCDGYNRISQSSTVTVSSTAKLRTSAGGTTSLSVKNLTLNTGSFVQVD
jgi:hypothetical protein